ncbi:hypothetical protein CONPUDRAFT_51896 [Coniophora puteana RWD-64-598 SS2]|uniref:CREG-like beta-barrel domain-containing protein n=1 Tax=Coniophora puteana (strain RWD-64-598) TaxID=741705 RepID=A0A5M3MVR9_CONPW|nr:uncharacterized protein CONPUDRAFT_51896 [Coniophora puteana RWD-64-598 SS2]EIW83140.1 hypothetical protein CONPUDRAFT_51896 [Coniophora puteana RWD-64-598 SS2]
MGTVTVYENAKDVPDREALQACYLAAHPDAEWWLPEDEEAAHISYWARFDPHHVYFVGGFGDEHFIGYVPLDMYREALPSRKVIVDQSSR